ncbi:MAG: sulfur oxidation c-type cytochrome SoxA [Magnetovibrionaceae bacterium]
MQFKTWTLGLCAAVGLSLSAGAALADGHGGKEEAHDWGPYQVEDRRSGFTYATKETQAIQMDNFENPGMLWVETGQELWETEEGEAGKACASCHEDAAETMKGVATVYPKYDAKLGKLVNIEQRINMCRTENMKADAWKWESEQLLGMTTFIRHQSLGMPMNVKVDGEAAPFFEKGKAFYYERRGQLDMACSHCHADHAGEMLRANTLTQGQGNGFPTYRLKWQKVGSLHRRFRGCNGQVRADRFGYGSEEYTNLELYVMWRGRDLPVETPAVRN